MNESKTLELAEEIFLDFYFPIEYIDANGWWILEKDRVFVREVFLQEPDKEETTCYTFTVEFYRDTDRIKRIELLNKE